MTEQTLIVTAKPWYKSKTMIANIILMALGLLMYILQGLESGQLESPWAIDQAQLTFWYGVLGTILRFVTTQPLEVGKS